MSQGEGRHYQRGAHDDSHVGTFSSGHPYGTLGSCLFWCEYGRTGVKAGVCGSQAERQSQGAEGVETGVNAQEH